MFMSVVIFKGKGTIKRSKSVYSTAIFLRILLLSF